MKKNYVLGLGILGMGIISTISLTYAHQEKPPFHQGEMKNCESLSEEEKAEMETKRAEMKEKMKTELKEQLDQGKITQEEYEKRIENIEKGKIKCPHEFSKEHEKNDNEKKEPKGPRNGGFQREMKELTEEEKAEMETKRAEMQEKMKTELKEQLDQGKITQEEYEQRLEQIEKNKNPIMMKGIKKGEKAGNKKQISQTSSKKQEIK